MSEKFYGDPFERGDQLYTNEVARFSSIHEIENNPNFIAKEIDTPEMALAPEELLSAVKPEVELQTKYLGNFIPKNYLVIAKKGEKNRLYQFMEKVTPVTLEMDNQLMYCHDLDQILEKSIQILQSTMDDQGDGRFPDIKWRNLVFGKVINENDPKLFLVDLYPMEYKNLYSVELFMGEVIKKYGEIYNFPLANNLLQSLKNK